MSSEKPTGRPVEKKRQLSREDWIEAAQLVLVTQGVAEVKVDRLARRMKVTRGGFYWHFENRKDLLDALLDRWRKQNETEIEKVRSRIGTEPERLTEVVRIWLGEEAAYPAFDMAIRVWARKAPAIATMVRKVDEEWIELLRSILHKNGDDPLESLARARIVYFHQIGYYALALDESMEERLNLAPYYNRVLGLGGEAELAEMLQDMRMKSAPKSKGSGKRKAKS